ncbi:MAG TPA: hypothetical protein VEZ14_07515 [Dehalococcoidia bacterium]|nr:hypothetical protein [Dehalococcoidia bacterium]
MATTVEPATTAPLPGPIYVRWRAEPPFRLLNLAGDPDAWGTLPLDAVELLLFDQCLVFGAAYPGPLYALDHIARRDRVVRVARDRLRIAYACFVARSPADRRIAIAREVAQTVALHLGSAASLIPFVHWDTDEGVRDAASALVPIPSPA